LRDAELAKNCLKLLARELHMNMSENDGLFASNCLLVLGDLTIKYTNLVDRYLPVMAACLQAGVLRDSETSFLAQKDGQGSPLIRKHAVLTLSSLLLQDYIKWRGLMFHRFLLATADSDEGVAQLAEMTLCGPLLNKFPRLFMNNFVESLFVLNRCTAHPIYRVVEGAGSDMGATVGFDGIHLDNGDTGQAKRMEMYKMMISNFSDEQKMAVTGRLAKEVLGAAVDSGGDLGRVSRRKAMAEGTKRSVKEESAYAVLSDALRVLASPLLRVGRATAKNDEEDVVDPKSNVRTNVASAKGKLLSSLSRRHMIEIILPILCNLKSILQDSCSPLLKDLMQYMTEIFRSYKQEAKELLASDPTLLMELEYDSRQFSKARKRGGMATPDRDVLEVLRSPRE